MNISCLQTFLSVVQTGNLNKAALLLNVTQSTVTARLDTLEDSLGQRLLVRSRRGAEMTKAGFAFRRHAELIVMTWEIGRKKVDLPKGFSGHFSLACHHDLWEAMGAKMIARIAEEQPELAMDIWPGDPDEIRRWMASGLVDAALTLLPLTDAGLDSSRTLIERLVQVSNVDRKVQDWDTGYIFVDHGAEFRRNHAATWSNHETPRFTFASSRWALDHLFENGGSAYLPWRLAEPHVAAGRLFCVDGSTEFKRSLYLIWRGAALNEHPWLPEAATYLAEACLS